MEDYNPQYNIEPKLDKKVSYTYFLVIALILLNVFFNNLSYVGTDQYSQLKGLVNMIHILSTLFLIILIPFGGLLVIVNLKINFKLKGKYIFLMRLIGSKKGTLTSILSFPLIRLFFKNTIIALVIINIFYFISLAINTFSCTNFLKLNGILIFCYAIPFFIVISLLTLKFPSSIKTKKYI